MKHTNAELLYWLSRNGLSVRWACSIGTIKRREKDGSLPAYRLGNRARYKLEDVLRFEEQARTSPTTGRSTVGVGTPATTFEVHTIPPKKSFRKGGGY
jgi:hypothetical protein